MPLHIANVHSYGDLGMTMYKLRNFFQELFSPVAIKCLSCGKDIFTDVGFCDECIKTVVFNNGKKCKRCGVAIDGEEDYCGNCAFDKVYFDRAYSAFSYEGALRNAILDMKFHGMGVYAKVFARYLAYIVVQENLQFDVVCFAPMSRNSLKERGYNQAKMLARELCNLLGNDCFCEAIIKIKETERQEELGKEARKQNLVGSYKINADVKGKRVLVVDDIKTTGATLNECAKVLKRAGATCVVGITVAARKEKPQFELED